MKVVNVVAAIILQDEKILATQRAYGDFKGGWEFPGGKIENGESKEDALKREIMEELVIQINIKEFFHQVEYDYEKFHLSMGCFICTIDSGNLTLKEHGNAKWLRQDELESVDWLPADLGIIEKLKVYLKQ